MLKMMRLQRQIQKLQELENGKRQFRALPQPQNKAYVWVGNISIPVELNR